MSGMLVATNLILISSLKDVVAMKIAVFEV